MVSVRRTSVCSIFLKDSFVLLPCQFVESAAPYFAVYSAEEWDKLEQRINQLPMSRGRSIKRYFFSNAVTVEPDKQGRILLPPHLREYAHLEKDVIVTGASDHAEIWDVNHWQSYIGHLTSESVAQELDSLEF